MNNNVYNILTQNSKVKYNTLSLLQPEDGVNYCNGVWKKVYTLHFTNSDSSEVRQLYPYYDPAFNSGATNILQECMILRVHGTIERSSLTDGTVFYAIIDQGPKCDQYTLIPANQNSVVTNVDFNYINTNDIGTCHMVYLSITPYNNSYKNVNSIKQSDMYVDLYSI